jgi:AbrB family looped-hinge helix DNA binding protein
MVQTDTLREYRSTISSKGQVTVPAAIRQLLHLDPSDSLVWKVRENGEIVVTQDEFDWRSVRGSIRYEGVLSEDLDQEIEEAMTDYVEEKYADLFRK